MQNKYDGEIGELADAINFMSSEIKRNHVIKNDFISSVSHELRTPMTAITGWAETLLAGNIKRAALRKRGLPPSQRSQATCARWWRSCSTFRAWMPDGWWSTAR